MVTQSQVSLVHVQTASEYHQGWTLHHIHGQSVPMLSTPPVKKFPHVQRELLAFQHVPITSGAVTGHHVKDPAIPPGFVPSTNLLRVHSAPPFSPLTKTWNSLGPSTGPSGYWPSIRLGTTDLWAQLLRHFSVYLPACFRYKGLLTLLLLHVQSF